MMFRVLTAAAVAVLVTSSGVFAADGAAIYEAQCSKCHGKTGQSDTPVGKALKVPVLAGDAKVQKMSEDDIVAGIHGNAKHPAAVKSLSADDAKAVAAHVKQLAGK